MHLAVNGLVARSYHTGDRDLVLQIITENNGRLSVVVKGGGSKKEGSLYSTQLFTYGNFELYQKKGEDFYWLRTASTTRSFYALTEDVNRTALANYICEVGSECSGEDFEIEDTAAFLRLILNTLHVLKETDKPLRVVKAVFELRAAALLGYTPDLLACASCGEGFPEDAYVDVMNGCFICGKCQAKRNRTVTLRQITSEDELRQRHIVVPVSASVIAAMRYTLAADDRKIFSFRLKDEEEERCFERVAEAFLLHNLERDFRTLYFYRKVEMDELLLKGYLYESEAT